MAVSSSVYAASEFRVAFAEQAIWGTANTTQCLMEALGMTLPNAAAIPAATTMKAFIARDSGRRPARVRPASRTPRAGPAGGSSPPAGRHG